MSVYRLELWPTSGDESLGPTPPSGFPHAPLVIRYTNTREVELIDGLSVSRRFVQRVPGNAGTSVGGHVQLQQHLSLNGQCTGCSERSI